MSNQADTAVYRKDGNPEFSGGMDGSQDPSQIARDKLANMVNCTCRGGVLHSRPIFVRRDMSFPDQDTETAFKTGRFQHLFLYDSGRFFPALLSSIGGRQFKQNIATGEVQEITPATGPNSERLTLNWSVQAENYWILQDNQSFPIIFDGTSSRRSNPADSEIPVGNVMAYANGRIIVALPDRFSFRAGDLLYGPSGTPALGYKDAILKFTENSYLNEGGDLTARVFGAPSNYGEIRSMRATSQTDTQLGQGALIVSTPLVIFTVNLPFDRTTWKNLTQPIETVVPIMGSTGQNSTLNINSDQWYRAQDGIRSYVMSQRQTNTWAQTPLSTELDDLLEFDTQSLLEYGSGCLFDNRMLQTVSPVFTTHGVWHRGLTALDFHIISTMTKTDPPAWEGLWTGLRILQIVSGLVNGQQRCFLYVLNDADEIECWELLTQFGFDNNVTRIQGSFDLPSYNCGDSNNFKKLEAGNFVVEDIQGQIDLAIKYRSDQNLCWRDWDTWSFCAAYQDCGPFDCSGPKQMQRQYRDMIRLHQPPDDADDINGRLYRFGYEFQPRVEFTGSCQFKQFRIIALDAPETINAERSIN